MSSIKKNFQLHLSVLEQKERDLFDRKKISNDIVDLPSVQDEERGYLRYSHENCSWEYIRTCFFETHQIKSDKKDAIPFILLLESPHKFEFIDKSNPRPAMGETGENICRYLKNLVQKSIDEKKFELNTENEYRVWIVNAIRYQCSCYNFLKKCNPNGVCTKQLHKGLKNKVFTELWSKPEIQDDLNDRLLSIVKSPDSNYILLNCVTGNFNKKIQKFLIDKKFNPTKQLFYHPSSWKPNHFYSL